jgi:hypothetical protein
MTDPTENTTEVARLRALLAALRTERDDLTGRLVAVLDEPRSQATGQQEPPRLP